MTDLTQFPELFVRQEIEHLEVFTGFETANRYSVRTPSGEQLPVCLRGIEHAWSHLPQEAPPPKHPRHR